MCSLKIGDSVKMKYGGEAKVLAEFGSGGQGTVYKVLYTIFLAFGVVYIMIYMYIYPVLAKFYNTIKN